MNLSKNHSRRLRFADGERRYRQRLSRFTTAKIPTPQREMQPPASYIELAVNVVFETGLRETEVSLENTINLLEIEL